MAISDTIAAQVNDLMAERARVKALAQARIAEIDARLALLASASKLVTPELQQMVDDLGLELKVK